MSVCPQASHSPHRPHRSGAVTAEEVRLLFATASHALDGSLIEMACLRLLSSLLKADPKVFHLLLKDAKLAGACRRMMTCTVRSDVVSCA